MAGKLRKISSSRPRHLGGVSVLALAMLAAGCGGGGPSRSSLAAQGERVFVASGCGHCHTVASARTHGATGPNFDTSEQLTRAQIRSSLDEGANGMPSYRGRLSAAQADAVTEFVFQTLHHRR